MGLSFNRLDAERQSVAAQIGHLIATDGFVEDLVYLEQQHTILASAITVWHAERARTVSDLISWRQRTRELAACLTRLPSPSADALREPSDTIALSGVTGATIDASRAS